MALEGDGPHEAHQVYKPHGRPEHFIFFAQMTVGLFGASYKFLLNQPTRFETQQDLFHQRQLGEVPTSRSGITVYKN